MLLFWDTVNSMRVSAHSSGSTSTVAVALDAHEGSLPKLVQACEVLVEPLLTIMENPTMVRLEYKVWQGFGVTLSCCNSKLHCPRQLPLLWLAPLSGILPPRSGSALTVPLGSDTANEARRTPWLIMSRDAGLLPCPGIGHPLLQPRPTLSQCLA